MAVWTAYIRLALASLRRHPLRAFVTCLAVALAVSLFLGALGLHDGYALALARGVDRMGYHVLVTAKGCPYETATLVLRGGNIPMYIDDSLVDRLQTDPAWDGGTRFLMQGLEIGGGRPFTVFMGVDDQFRPMKPWMTLQQGSWFSGPEAGEAILGYNVAETLRYSTGDTIELERYGRTLRVIGVFTRSGAQDDGMIFLPVAYAQKLFERQGKLTGVGVRLTDLKYMSSFLDRVFEIPSMQAITVAQFRGTMMELLGSARALLLVGTVVAIIIAALGVFNAVLVSVTERRQQLGIFKVLGASPGQLFTLVAIETALIGAAGGLIGAGLAVAGGVVADPLVRQIFPWAPLPTEGSIVSVASWHVTLALAGAVGIALLAGCGPAARASRAPALASLRGGRG